jgi:hypothetical protein
VYSVFLCCFCTVLCIVSLLCCLFPNLVQVYRRLPPGGNSIALNKYHIIYHTKDKKLRNNVRKLCNSIINLCNSIINQQMHIYKLVQSHVVILHQHALVTSANIKRVSYKMIVFLL